MINLTPIAEAIQKRLFQKMKLLGRTGNTPNNPVSVGGLTNNQLSVRSTFIRMSSGLEEPVILMGGELNKDGKMTAGYDEIYGPRKINTYKKDEFGKVLDSVEKSNMTTNEFKRPMPGIKSIDVQFKGGQRAIRIGTVSWTCWSFEEIDRLMPHFLSVGKTILLEWGWVYDENSIQQMPTFIGNDGIKKEAYTRYKNSVLDANGDFDMLIGVVSNFDYTTRADGGFDCTTKISSMGVNLLANPTPAKGVGGVTPELDLTGKESAKELKDKLTSKEAESLITVPNITLKDMVEHIDHYCADKISKKQTFSAGRQTRKEILDKYQKTEVVVDTIRRNEYINSIDNQFVIKYQRTIGQQRTSKIDKIFDVWVRWGWFEDNILSKFLTIVSPGTSDNVPISEFRSVESIPTKKGKETKSLESVKIRNHPSLETTDINKYILPGQFKALEKNLNEGKSGIKATGDSKLIKELSKMVNEKFKPFTSSGKTFTTTDEIYADKEIMEDEVNKNPGKSIFSKLNPFDDVKTGRKIGTGKFESVGTGEFKTKPVVGDNGYVRNMLINTKLIKQAFGVGTDNTVESFNAKEAIESLFNLLNQDVPFWNFMIENDVTDAPYRNRIIDKTIDAGIKDLEVGEKINSPFPGKTVTKSVEDKNNGVFFFPVWRHDSFVKSQNISATIPSSMAISIMYGANAKKLKTAKANSEDSTDPAQTIAKTGNGETPDKRLDGLERAFSAKGFEKWGTISDTDSNTAVGKRGGDDNLSFWASGHAGHNDILSEKKRDKKTKKDSEIQAAASPMNKEEQKSLDELTKTIDSTPPPLPGKLTKEQWIKLSEKVEYEVPNSTRKNTFYSPLFQLYSSKYDIKGRMKQQFIDSVKFSIGFVKKTSAGTKTTTESSKPILLPVNLEIEIDGIGGIFPGNSFHSTYLPMRYQEDSVFQIFDVNHTVSNSGWTVAIKGKMRSTADRITKTVPIPKNETDDENKEKEEAIVDFTKLLNATNEKKKKEFQLEYTQSGDRITEKLSGNFSSTGKPVD
mgnify:FL=1|jgi:hypothetical protein|tara:strand:- start:650 stop:3724 length:3075 start_codon:yes stop_codon:yes gene_type:complete